MSSLEQELRREVASLREELERTRQASESSCYDSKAALKFLDAVDFPGLHAFDSRRLRHKDQRRLTRQC